MPPSIPLPPSRRGALASAQLTWLGKDPQTSPARSQPFALTAALRLDPPTQPRSMVQSLVSTLSGKPIPSDEPASVPLIQTTLTGRQHLRLPIKLANDLP